MMDSLYWQIINRLRAHLIGLQSLDQFEDWFVSHSWDAHQAADQAALDLISDIELRLAEHSDGHWSDEELWKFFMEKVLVAVPGETHTGSYSVTEHDEVRLPLLRPRTEYIESLVVPA